MLVNEMLNLMSHICSSISPVASAVILLLPAALLVYYKLHVATCHSAL